MKDKITLVTLSTLAVLPMATNNIYSTNIGIVTAPSLNIRSGPNTNYPIVTTVKKDDKVTILQSSNGWYKVEIESGKQGWVSSSYISILNDNTNIYINKSKNIAIVNTDGLKFRNGAGTNYSIIKVLSKGEKVELISESNGWSKVRYNSRLGYVASRYIDKDTTENYKEIKVVNTDGLNVRKGPSTSYTSMGKLDIGTKVEVISESNGWSKINYNKTTGYVATRYLDKKTINEDTTEDYKELKVVNTDGLNVRKGPSTSYTSMGKLAIGTKV